MLVLQNSSSMLQTLLEKHSNSIKITNWQLIDMFKLEHLWKKNMKYYISFMCGTLKSQLKKKIFWIYVTFSRYIIVYGKLTFNCFISIFCRTAIVEVFRSVLNRYCPKRLHFTLQGMIARTQLAVLDYNCSSNITQATRNDGKRRNKHFFSKMMQNWVVKNSPKEKI